jgi:hypothetical protein
VEAPGGPAARPFLDPLQVGAGLSARASSSGASSSSDVIVRAGVITEPEVPAGTLARRRPRARRCGIPSRRPVTGAHHGGSSRGAGASGWRLTAEADGGSVGAAPWQKQSGLRSLGTGPARSEREDMSRRIFFVTLRPMFLVTPVESGGGVVLPLGGFDVTLFR